MNSFFFQSRDTFLASSLYRLHNTSEHSVVTNMYSLSNNGTGGSSSRVPTPTLQQQQLMQHQHQGHARYVHCHIWRIF